MRRRDIVTGLFAGFLLTAAGARQAVARCMDDAGDAIAAFFTGGVSYAICQIIETVEALIQTVRTVAERVGRLVQDTISAAQRFAQEAARSVESNTRALLGEMGTMVNEARQFAQSAAPGRPPGPALDAVTKSLGVKGMTPALPGPPMAGPAGPARPLADPAELERALREGADLLGRIHQTVQTQVANHILSAAETAGRAVLRHLDAARRIAESVLLAPLRVLQQLLSDLLRHPERLFDPSAQVRETLRRVTNAMLDIAAQIHREVTEEALATLRDADRHVRRMTADAGLMTRVHGAMARAHRERTGEALDELRAALRAAGGGGAAGAGTGTAGVPPSVALSALARLDIGRLAQEALQSQQQSSRPFADLAQSLTREGDKLLAVEARGLQAALPPQVEQRARNELQRMLQGKSQAEAEEVKRNLKSQALARYQAQPKVREAVERNFDTRFADFLRANPALLRQAAPIRVQPGVFAPPK